MERLHGQLRIGVHEPCCLGQDETLWECDDNSAPLQKLHDDSLNFPCDVGGGAVTGLAEEGVVAAVQVCVGLEPALAEVGVRLDELPD